MNNLNLPSDDDTKFKVTLPCDGVAKQVEFDMFDIDMMRSEAFDAAKKAGEETMIPTFCVMFKDAYKVSLNRAAAAMLLEAVDKQREHLKKKLNPSPDLSDSTESSPTPE
jgi:hypothetical protein